MEILLGVVVMGGSFALMGLAVYWSKAGCLKGSCGGLSAGGGEGYCACKGESPPAARNEPSETGIKSRAS